MISKKTGFIFALSTLLGAQAPEWFSYPSLDHTKLYGLGTGKTPQEAKQNAIIDLASSLQSSIQTDLKKQTKRVDSQFSSSSSQNINIQTKMINLFNINEAQAECDQKQCYAQIEIQRSKFIEQLAEKLQENIKQINDDSPFTYLYKKEILYPNTQNHYALYRALGGSKIEMPKVPQKPTLDLSFQYNKDFPSSFKEILEKSIQSYITKFAKISSESNWKISIDVLNEAPSVILNISAKHKDETIHTASISDIKKDAMSAEFFAKRLSAQMYKTIQKWEIPKK